VRESYGFVVASSDRRPRPRQLGQPAGSVEASGLEAAGHRWRLGVSRESASECGRVKSVRRRTRHAPRCGRGDLRPSRGAVGGGPGADQRSNQTRSRIERVIRDRQRWRVADDFARVTYGKAESVRRGCARRSPPWGTTDAWRGLVPDQLGQPGPMSGAVERPIRWHRTTCGVVWCRTS